MQTGRPAVGQLNALGYTVYGYRHTVGDLPHLPGFNGELPDPLTGHYLLGNGYRAFNPVLMRFNSPDNQSPFGQGGINAYAYCTGDPVNRTDPTGHMPILLKKALRGLNLMPKKIEAKGIARNVQSLEPNLISFEEKLGRRKRLTLYGHGLERRENGYHKITSAQRAMPPTELYQRAKKSNIDFNNYDDVRILMCFSGAAAKGQKSFITQFSEIINKPVRGYASRVVAAPPPEQMENIIDHIRLSSDRTYKNGVNVYKRNPFRPGHKEYSTFSYEKVTAQGSR